MPTIGNTFQTAQQSLNAIQVQLGAISQNIANAQNPNYNRRDVTFSDTGNGVSVDVSITRASDVSLRNQILDATSQVAGADARSDIFQALAQSNGAAQGTSTAQDNLGRLSVAISAFDADPSQAANEAAVIQTADTFASNVRRQFADLRQGEALASNQASQAIGDLNTKLSDLAAINVQARAEFAGGGIDPQTADRRDAALKDLAKLVPLSVTENADGSVAVQTKTGVPLVDKSASQFAFDTANNNVYLSGSAPPAAYGAAGSLNGAFQGGRIGAQTDALDPSTTNPSPAVGVFAKARAQLSALVDTFANTSTFTNAQPGSLVNAYAAAPASRASDLAGGAAPSQGLFTTQSNPGQNDEESFAVNPQLLAGTATIKQGASAALVSFFTTPNQSIGAPGAPVGGLTLAQQTPGQLAGGITNFWSAAQGTASSQAAQFSGISEFSTNAYAARNGVDVDRELVNLTQAQNLYKATAKILDVQDQTFKTLLDILK